MSLALRMIAASLRRDPRDMRLREGSLERTVRGRGGGGADSRHIEGRNGADLPLTGLSRPIQAVA